MSEVDEEIERMRIDEEGMGEGERGKLREIGLRKELKEERRIERNERNGEEIGIGGKNKLREIRKIEKNIIEKMRRESGGERMI